MIVSGYKMSDKKRPMINHQLEPTGRPTIQDVASEAGVSTGTVSRVINNRAGVKAITRQQVLLAMQRLNYRPDSAARELSLRQMTRVGLSIAAGNRRLIPYFVLFLEYLINELQTDGYRLEEIPSRSDGLPEWLTDAVVLFGAHDDDLRLSYLQQRSIPFVLVGHHPGVRWVMPDDYNGGRQATEHLLRLGHREIVHLSGYMNNQSFQDRYQGHCDTLQAAGVQPRRDYLLDGDFTSLGGYRAVRKALEQGLRFSAIFAASDEMAVGAIAALGDMGLRVPMDVSVVGFDDLPEIGESLTTIRQDIAKIAATAVKLLKQGLLGQPVQHEVVPVQLIVRGTTARRR